MKDVLLASASAKCESGFTLVELSMVIVIIGLIVVGIVAGRSLLQTSKMNAQIIDLNKFETAYNAFKLEYDAIPCDMRNASSYWAGARNGNGNYKISNNSGQAHDAGSENTIFLSIYPEQNLYQKLIPVSGN